MAAAGACRRARPPPRRRRGRVSRRMTFCPGPAPGVAGGISGDPACAAGPAAATAHTRRLHWSIAVRKSIADTAAFADIGRGEQPRFDEGVQVGVVQPDGNELLDLFGGDAVAACAVAPRDHPRTLLVAVIKPASSSLPATIARWLPGRCPGATPARAGRATGSVLAPAGRRPAVPAASTCRFGARGIPNPPLSMEASPRSLKTMQRVRRRLL